MDLLVQRIYSKDKSGKIGNEAAEGERRAKEDMAAGGSLVGEQANHNYNGGILVAKPNELMGGSNLAKAMERKQLGPAVSGGELKTVSGGELKPQSGGELKSQSGGEQKKKPPVDLVVQTIRKDHGERQRMAAALGGNREVKVNNIESGGFDERQNMTSAARGPPLDGKEEHNKDVKEKEDREKEAKEKELKEKEKRENDAKEKEVKRKEKGEKGAQIKGKGSRKDQDMVAGGTLIGKQAKRLIARTLKVKPLGKEKSSSSGKTLWRELARNKLANNPGRLAIPLNTGKI